MHGRIEPECRLCRTAIESGAIDDPAGPGATRAHLARCAACGAYVERWRAVRATLAAPRADVRPDAGFARRVVAALPLNAPVEDAFLWAAVRLLPAAAVLALLLAGAAFELGRTPLEPGGALGLGGSGDLLTDVALSDGGAGSAP